ncbi:hypothetical protein Acy02nite_68890 [Actinoplanes cyaneus]|uniref:Uncharacterized protein n=1 Tax=Actinoplanes cyaneus TaxID=52696 RepID=A0A919M925_9ACTN|nr:hypothetical protein [Actinoplanes cyaneus]MCW2139063.1 hypothetical protein [Actinoplanes cyaneus]GID69008.1 hypothetical protein Acy02nite_68890 [Actinoplanes cyaneus]
MHDTIATAIYRQTLRHAVSHAMFCAHSGRILDVRTAVLVTATAPDSEPSRTVLHHAVYDKIAERLSAAAEEAGTALEVIDGRTL